MTINTRITILLMSFMALSPCLGEERREEPNYVNRSDCLLDALDHADPAEQVGDLRERCPPQSETEKAITERLKDTPLRKRWWYEQSALNNPFALTAHRSNFFLPILYIHNPNTAPYESFEFSNFDNTEFQFQLSVKAQIARNLFGSSSGLFLTYTNRSFWQAYNSDISAPFRETNHEPELLMMFPSRLSIYGFKNIVNLIGFNHQSNGRPGDLSRSWNRMVFETTWEKAGVVLSLRPWYRFSERDDRYEGDPGGDDNPDITRFLGNFEFKTTVKKGQHSFVAMLRNNLRSDNKGAIELGWTMPLGQSLRGFLKFFSGYGESMIDYNAHTTSLGFGFILSEWI